ncbi:MAG: glycoside hydrolase family 127 protein [Planctomycetota bacterium]|jgi:DUF1680 family protein
MNKNLTCCAVLTALVSLGQLCLAGDRRHDRIDPNAYSHAKLRPVRLHDAKITGGYLGGYIGMSRRKGVLDYLSKFERLGHVDNFRIVARGSKNKHVGGPNNDEFLYKLIEAAGYHAAEKGPIRAVFTVVNDAILSAQADDGYLNTYYDNPQIKAKNPDNRFKPTNRFEFYNFAHLTQAAIAWYRSTGDRKLLDGMIKFADLICEKFSAPNLLPYTRNRNNRPNLKYEHPNHEMAMVELYRVTGNKRYLDFARHTLDQYGFWDFEEVWGHAVQETLLLAGGADVYLESGEPAMLTQLEKMWHDVRDRKMYITGGIGSKGFGESFGGAYELPNESSYCETCAAISKVFWDYRMLLATGDCKYADDMERTLYNAVLVGISLDGTEYFYQNKMEVKPGKNVRRMPWFGCSCCPPNVQRLLGSLQQYFYTVDDSGIAVHLYNTGRVRTETPSGRAIALQQATDYPTSGKVWIRAETAGEFSISLRVPGWAGEPKVEISGENVKDVRPGRYCSISRKWNRGDVIAIDFGMKPRLVPGNEKVKDQAGKVAILRGPLVYCLEQIDNDPTDIFDISIPKSCELTEQTTHILNGIVIVKGSAIDRRDRNVEFKAIPYHLWANRGPTAMRVWIERADN